MRTVGNNSSIRKFSTVKVTKPTPTITPVKPVVQEAYADTGNVGTLVPPENKSVANQVIQGIQNQFLDYQGIVNPEYQNKSILNQVIDSSIQGDFDRAGNLIKDNPIRFATNVGVEVVTSVIPVAPVLKALKLANVGSKVISKGGKVGEKVVDKVDESIDYFVRYGERRKITRKYGKNVPEQVKDDFDLGAKSIVSDNIDKISGKIENTKVVQKMKSRSIGNKKFNMYQIIGADDKGKPFFSPWMKAGGIDPVFAFKAVEESPLGKSGVFIRKTKMKGKDVNKYSANVIYETRGKGDDGVKLYDVYPKKIIEKNVVKTIGDMPYTHLDDPTRWQFLEKANMDFFLTRERNPTYVLTPFRVNTKAKVIKPKDIDKGLAKEMVSYNENSEALYDWALRKRELMGNKSLQEKYAELAPNNETIDFNRVISYMEDIRKANKIKAVMGGTSLGLSSSQKTTSLRKNNKKRNQF